MKSSEIPRNFLPSHEFLKTFINSAKKSAFVLQRKFPDQGCQISEN